MKITDIDILMLIPQRPPFVMIDTLLHVDDNSAIGELTITDNNIFTIDGVFSEAGMIEHIAQICAAGMGHINVCMHNNTPKIGFLSAIKNMEFKRQAKVGEILNTCVTIENFVMNIILVKTEVKINNEIVAKGSMKIFITAIETENDG
jgi:3-hydroxymyristoyl/3-hydroxydecanoyl-(acyl carrier protein) dehydratase